MTGFTPPLHIDFILTYADEKKKRGYWFLTWIFGPDKVVVWCKLHDGNWRLETPSAHNMFPVPDATETIGKHRLVRSGNLKEFMDATLAEYMRTNNNFTESHHFYWLKDKPQSQLVENFQQPAI
jgi:hypothetical protein